MKTNQLGSRKALRLPPANISRFRFTSLSMGGNLMIDYAALLGRDEGLGCIIEVEWLAVGQGIGPIVSASDLF